MHKNQRIPVQYLDGTPAMPTQFYRAEKWVEQGKAEWVFNDLRIKQVRLRTEPLTRNVQPIVVGVNPGKYYSGVGVQSSKATLFLAHLELPFKLVKKRMEQRAMMRRTRRSRRIDRTVEFKLRNHRQKRFSNRTQKKVPPSIRANCQVELRVVTELSGLFPISEIVYEYVKAKTLPGCSFSPVQVGQNWAIERLSKIATVRTLFGWQTATLRDHLNLFKTKKKSEQSPASHAVDGVALASSAFVSYQSFNGLREHGHRWMGSVQITPAQFVIVKRPPICRRQLHLLQPAKGGIRRAYGGTITRHAGLRKGDLVKAEQAGRVSIGWVSGDTAKQVSVSDFDWKRIGQFTASKVTLILRVTGILVNCPRSLSVVGALNP